MARYTEVTQVVRRPFQTVVHGEKDTGHGEAGADGRRVQSYNDLTGDPGSYSYCLEAIKLKPHLMVNTEETQERKECLLSSSHQAASTPDCDP